MSNKTDAEEILTNLIAIIVDGLLTVMIFGISLWVTMCGWGLTVHSWPVVISGWIFIGLLRMMMFGLSRLGKQL